MSIFESQSARNNKKIIHVLDRLLDFSVRDFPNKNFDFRLYKILNSPDVYQKIIHMGVLPIINHSKEVSKDFMRFVNNLWLYIEYDVNTDFLWVNTLHNSLNPDHIKQKEFHNKASAFRKEILTYIYDKKVISSDLYQQELNHKVKEVNEG